MSINALGGSILTLDVEALPGTDRIYFGGSFSDDGGKPLNVVVWDGTSFLPVAVGQNEEVVNSLAVVGPDGSKELFLGEELSSSVLGPAYVRQVTELTPAVPWLSAVRRCNLNYLCYLDSTDPNSLYCTSNWVNAGMETKNCSRLHRWYNGFWGSVLNTPAKRIDTLAAIALGQKRSLAAGGRFEFKARNELSAVGLLHGPRWIAYVEFFYPPDAKVYALTSLGGRIFAGGEFTRALGWDSHNVVCLTAGAAFSLPGLNDTVRALCVYDGKIVAGGDFTQSDAGQPLAHLALLSDDLRTWAPLGSGVDGRVNALCNATLMGKQVLIAAGEFATISGHKARAPLAIWDGSDLLPF